MIRDFQVGEVVRQEVGVLESAIKQASNGPYLLLKVTDGTSSIVCKQWSYQKETVPEVGSVVEIRGTVGEYKGVKDVNLLLWKPTEGADISQFRKQASDEPKLYFDKIVDKLVGIRNQEVYTATMDILSKYKERLMYVPAAVGCHHDTNGGLLQHMYEVMKIAADVGEFYGKIMKVDMSYVIAGAILHDIGKVICYDFEGIAPVMTDKGKFSDHIVYGPIMVSEFIDDEQLVHIIASHHGKKEYGSPVVPCTIEAYIVSVADELSAKMHVFKDELEAGTGWNDSRNFYLGTRVFRGNE